MNMDGDCGYQWQIYRWNWQYIWPHSYGYTGSGATLRSTSVEGQGGGNLMMNSNQLSSAGQDVQRPVTGGGSKTKVQKFRDELIWCWRLSCSEQLNPDFGVLVVMVVIQMLCKGDDVLSRLTYLVLKMQRIQIVLVQRLEITNLSKHVINMAVVRTTGQYLQRQPTLLSRGLGWWRFPCNR